MQAQRHRGAHPEDRELFSVCAVSTLRQAVEQAVYLLDHGYAMNSVVDVVSRRHALRARQRLALQRSICSTEQRRLRQTKRVKVQDLRGVELAIDGFNLIIGLEVALSGGVLLRGYDGAIRDLAGLRGTYHPVDETRVALRALGYALSNAHPSAVHVWLDRPVSNSGRLRGLIMEQSIGWQWPVEVALTANPDRDLFNREYVVTSDSNVLDKAASWVNLLEWIIDSQVPNAWLVDLYA